MPKNITDIYNLFSTQLSGWTLKTIPDLTNEEKEKTGLSSFPINKAGILVSPDKEEIVVSFSNTAVTGMDRPKPQIRIEMDIIISAYKYSRIKQLRYFAFVICPTDPAALKLPPGVIPDDYLVSLESSVDRCQSGRIDIRSIYDVLANNLTKNFFRVPAKEHTCPSIEQASFIRISDTTTPVILDELLAYLTYFDNRPYLLSTKEGSRLVYQPSTLFNKAEKCNSKYPWNMLVFGAPGTGKSHLLENKLDALKSDLGDKKLVVMDRVTFYSDYTYQQFVGGYMPLPKADMQETIEVTSGKHNFSGNITGQHISYEFAPGPFGSLLAKAFGSKLKNDSIKYVLIIEELNRANAASVFGDIFQLLDRDKGVSNYFISVSDAFAEYLYNAVYDDIIVNHRSEADQLSIESFRMIKLPENLYIWSTMNSADQGVFALDSAFKRRWSFIYKDINSIAAAHANRPTLCLPNCDDKDNVHAEKYDWNQLRKAINKIILKSGFDEDRCVGYWFFSEDEIADIETHTKCVVKVFHGDSKAAEELETLPDPFMNKLLSYLRQDVFRNIPTKFFQKDCTTLSEIRLATNYLEIKEQKPVSLKGHITVLTDDAFSITTEDTPASGERDAE